MNKYLQQLSYENENLKNKIKDATYEFQKTLKQNNLKIKLLKELINLFGEDSLTYNFGNSVNYDDELLADYRLKIPVNTKGVKYKLYTYANSISYVFYYNIKRKLIFVSEYEIYNDNIYNPRFININKEDLKSNINDYSIFSTKKLIENKILEIIKHNCNKITELCIANDVDILSTSCPRIKFSGYNEKFFSEYQEEYFKTLALFK